MTEHYSTNGAICPYCGHLDQASDSDGDLYDESRCEWECGICGEEYRVSAYNQWSWTTEKMPEPADPPMSPEERALFDASMAMRRRVKPDADGLVKREGE